LFFWRNSLVGKTVESYSAIKGSTPFSVNHLCNSLFVVFNMDLVKLQVSAGQAPGNPPIGPILGQKGINSVEFSKQFNEATDKYPTNWVMAVKASVLKRKFTLNINYPSSMFFLKRAAKLKKSNGTLLNMPNMSIRWIYEVAQLKKRDPKWKDLDDVSMCKILLGTCRSMHIELTD
jgi:large subunit ribosomal protein L11